MRFVTWNLWAGDSRAKLAKLSPTPDVGVFCEVSQALTPEHVGEPVPAWEWEGTLLDRGVAIASWSKSMQRVEPPENVEPGHLGLAVQLASGIGIVGIWACPEAKGRSYGAEVRSTIDAFEPLLRSSPCVVAGDFNVTPGGAADRRSGITKRLDELGYVSAYHAFHDVDFGDEPATYYHQFNNDKPFHIDMVFVPKPWVPTIRSVDIAPFNGWVDPSSLRSDHVPVSVDIDLDHSPSTA